MAVGCPEGVGWTGDAGVSGAETDGSGTGLVELGYLGGVAALSFHEPG